MLSYVILLMFIFFDMYHKHASLTTRIGKKEKKKKSFITWTADVETQVENSFLSVFISGGT